MISFLLALTVLFVGYLLYGRLSERIFAPDDRLTPANAINDGVNCIPMKPWKALLIQLLNIAGTGPIFGALMGACFGPIVFLPATGVQSRKMSVLMDDSDVAAD